MGKAEATWAIVAASASATRLTSGQPRPMLAPPAAHRPTGNDVMPPARMQMIDREMQ